MKYLFFDTETAGFNGPILQLAWILTDENGEVLEQSNHLIDHHFDYEIQESALAVHGITKERCQAEGDDPMAVIDTFERLMSAADVILAHNANFDMKMIEMDRARYGIEAPMPKKSKISCTMQATAHICKIPNSNGRAGYKWPKLQELHTHLFTEEFDGAHDALADVKATARCFFELKRLGLIG